MSAENVSSEIAPQMDEELQGSWIPLVIVVMAMFLWWLSTSTSPTALRIRRHYNTQRVQWKKRLGLRDDSVYKTGAAGDGANQRHKRQG